MLNKQTVNKKRKLKDHENSQSKQWSDSDYDDDVPSDSDNHYVQNDDDHYSGGDDEPSKQDFVIDSSVPLYKLLQEHKATNREKVKDLSSISSGFKSNKKKRDKISKSVEPTEKRHKNSPAEMRSDRPVRRLRVDADNSTRKFMDPRFADYTGELDQRIFAKNFEFLDEKRESEIRSLSKTIQKTKSTDMKEQMKKELYKLKQQHNERQLSLKVMERVDSLKQRQKDLVKGGKKPFFLKNSAKKDIIAEERYSLLKKQGKLQKFMNKKRKKNASRDRAKMPERRGFFQEQ